MGVISLEPLGSVSPFILGIAVIFLWYIVTTFISWYRLRHIPGPFIASLTYFWIGSVSSSGKMGWFWRDLPKKYGPLVRVGPNYLSTDDPEVLRKMSAARSTYGKDSWYKAAKMNPYHETMFTYLDHKTHDAFKAKLAGAYGGRETPALEPGVDAQVNAALDLIRRKYLSSSTAYSPLEFSEFSSYFTLDVITKVAFGEEFGCLKADADVNGFLTEVREFWPRLATTVDMPWSRAIVANPIFLKLFGPSPRDKKGLGRIMGIAEEVVNKRLKPGSNSEKDMMASMIRHGLTRDECEAESIFMIVAGADTTASVMRILMLQLVSNALVYQTFKKEIERVVREGKVSSPITYQQAQEIPYLRALVYEGIRMRAPAPSLYPKVVGPEGDVIHGKYVPPGTAIGMNVGGLLRSRGLFGQDAEIFRPGRFLEVDEQVRIKMEQNVDLAFGYGRWMCAGKPIAFMELYKMFFELFRAFDFQISDPTKPWESQSYSLWIEDNFWLRVTEAGLD